MDDAAERAAKYRGIAEYLRSLADKFPYDPHRHAQLLALAAGFDRYAERLAQDAVAHG